MTPGRSIILLCAAWFVAVAPDARAHSASDAYLKLTSASASAAKGTATETTIHGQWDVALRDLDFVLNLDADGNGRITWGEVRSRRAAIEQYVYDKLSFKADGVTCTIRPDQFRIADHADGAYAALSFNAACRGLPKTVALSYHLFFAIDPSHRAIVIWRAGDDTSTAVLSPQNPQIAVATAARQP